MSMAINRIEQLKMPTQLWRCLCILKNAGVVLYIIATVVRAVFLDGTAAAKCLRNLFKTRPALFHLQSMGVNVGETIFNKLGQDHIQQIQFFISCYVCRIQRRFFPPPWVTARCLWCNQTALMDESGVLELVWGHTIEQKMAAVLQTLRSLSASNSNT
jgi:hypothetical protein